MNNDDDNGSFQQATYLDPYIDHVDSHPHELSVAEIKRRYRAMFVDKKEPDSLAALAGLTLCLLFGILVTVFGEQEEQEEEEEKTEGCDDPP